MTIEELYQLYQQHPFIQTDTRKLKKGEIFFALKGENFNGNQFAQQALDSHAAAVLVDEKEFHLPGKTILVENVLQTLQGLAGFHRQQLDIQSPGKGIPFLAITGSNGKTTTKELIHAVMSTTFKTYTTAGNLNNHIGIPLTILNIKKDVQFAIIEMGANHPGEIAGYCSYTLPTHGIITNAGKAHLAGFGSEEGVRKAKGELFEYLRDHQGMIFVMWDYDYLREMSKGISGVIKYGTKENAHVIGKVLKSDPLLDVEILQGLDQKLIITNLAGDYNLPNVLAAITVGKYFGVPEANIVSAIENYIPSNSRSQLIKKGSNKIILDAYNANPSSMELAIENLARSGPGDKVLILGGMAELGDQSIDEHKNMIDLIGKYSWKSVVLVGGDFIKIKHPWKQFETSMEARAWMKEQQFENTAILIKGSRSMQMEKVLE